MSDLETAFLNSSEKFAEKDYPKISIIIPTYNCAQSISTTLDSILAQKYPSFEIIIVDNSLDRTVEAVKSYNSEKIRIYSTSHCHRYEMLNKGLSQARGEYVNFLFPGDFYICNQTLKIMMSLALQNQKPDLVYCGTLIRDGKAEVKILFRKLQIETLKKGQQPTSLQSSWFKAECVRELGKFNPSYSQRGGFDLMCRFALNHKYRFESIKRVLTDYDLRTVSRRMVITHFYETMRTVYKYFGLSDTVRWLFIQRDTHRFIKLWVRNLKIAFRGGAK